MVQKYIEEAPGGELTNPVGTEELAVTNRVTDYFIKIRNLVSEKLRELGGTVLSLGSVADGQLLKRTGTSIVGKDDYADTIRETGGPTSLTIGAIADGELLKRSGTGVTSRPDYAETLRETGGPTSLTIGAVADGQFLKRSGTSIVGDAGGGGGSSYPIYKIVPSVTSGNLSIALKHLDDTDPSSSNPIEFRVGDTVHSLESALSFTKNGGTNWCNAGASEFATKEVDYFLYAIDETGASAGLKFGFSRIPYAITMSDFVNTTTDEKYIAGNWTNFNGTDQVSVIGRFNAILSAGAGYTWSLPATSAIINRPIWETRWLSWQPSYSATGSMTFTSITTTLAIYKIENDKLTVNLDFNGTTGGTASWGIQVSPPIKLNTTKAPGIPYLPCYVIDTTKPGGYLRYAAASYAGIQAERLDEANWGLGAGRYVRGTLIYVI